ncbi:lipopolysaccharide biosynthesis protein, partial [Verrucomicrobiales bacterium]|nr:lipopolysaccharide biosynthesis protein [Verrucomicrobiales bacterium]
VVNVIDQFVKLLAVFFITPLMVSQLGDTRYGLWILIGTFFSYYRFLDVGISSSAPRFIGKAEGMGNRAERSLVLSICHRYFIRISIIAAAITALAMVFIPLFSNDEGNRNVIRWIACALGVSLSLRFYFQIHRVLLKSEMRYDLIVLASTIRVCIQSVLIYWLLSNNQGLVAIAIAQAGCDIFESFLCLLFARRVCPNPSLRGKTWDPKKSREILRYSMIYFGASSGKLLMGRIDPFLVGGLVGVTMVPIYSIGTRLLTIFNDLINALFGSHFMVALSQVEGRNGLDYYRERILEATRLCAILTTFIGGSLAIFSGPFLTRWVGPQFSDSYSVLLILIIPYVCFLAQYSGFSGLYALSKHRFIMITMWSGALGNLILSLIFGIYFGFFGIVWATFIEMTLLYCVIYPWGISRATAIPIRKYYSAIIFPILKTAFPLAAFYLLFKDWIKPEYGSLIFFATLECGIAGVWVWFALFTRSQQKAIRQAIGKISF